MACTARHELNLNIVVLYKIPVARHASPADLPIVDFNYFFFAKTQLLELEGAFIMMCPSKYKIQPKCLL
jgi:hypothetical protein